MPDVPAIFGWWVALLIAWHTHTPAGELATLHCQATHPYSQWVTVCHAVPVPPIKSPRPVEN